MTPTQRSCALLREQGYIVDIVESYNAFAHVRHDMFGWADIVAIHPKKTGVLAIQTTTASNINARVDKACGMKSFKIWISTGNQVEFHGWRKIYKKGTRQKIWEPIIIRIDVGDMFK